MRLSKKDRAAMEKSANKKGIDLKTLYSYKNSKTGTAVFNPNETSTLADFAHELEYYENLSKNPIIAAESYVLNPNFSPAKRILK